MEFIIRWGPLAVVAIVFLYYFIKGLILGTYKVARRVIYVILYVAFAWIFIDNITNALLDINVTINGVQGVRNFLIHAIESNDKVVKFLSYSPELKMLILEYPEIIISPIVFIILVVVVLPISFPVYWVYLWIWHLIAKYIFKREKYKKDEDGKFLYNEEGKKIKVERKKRRLLGGLISGVQGVVLICVTLMPVNFVNRIYNKSKKSAELNNGETLCSSVEFVKLNKDICKYLDIYNETIFAKFGGEKSLDKFISDSLTTVEVKSEKISLENELSNIGKSVVLLNDSGILDLLMQEEIKLETLDLSNINFDKINDAIDGLFSSYALSRLSEAGVGYVLNEVLDGKIVELLKDDDIVSKLNYEDSSQIKNELKEIVNIIKYMVSNDIDNVIIDNNKNVVGILNNIELDELETLLNKLLSLRIINKAMPSLLSAYGEKYGVNIPSEMTSELNEDFSKTFVNAARFVKTMEATSLEDLTKGNVVSNLTDAMFENGAIKDTSKESLAILLNDINSSYLFRDVISSELNKTFKNKEYKVDARILRYVDSKEAWLAELDVLDNAYVIYDEYRERDTINYSNVTSLLNDLSGTKVLISILPFAYDELLPKLGIEINGEGLPAIDFDKENEDASKVEFYNTWESELVLLKNVADNVEVLKLQSFDDISVSMLDEEENVEALANVMGEVYKSNLLKNAFAKFMSEKINSFVSEYNVSFTDSELLNINTSQKWYNEFININEILKIDFNDQNNINGTNLEKVFDAVSDMELFKTKKIDILKYAIKESEFLTEGEYNSISWPSDDQSIDTFWETETSVLVDVVNERNTIETLATNLDLKTMDVAKVGTLLDRVMDSSILNKIVTDKVSVLFASNGVKDDRDKGESTTYLKQNISSVGDWKKELSIIKDMLTMDKDTFDDKEGNKSNIEIMLDNIEKSELLKNTRANLLIKAINTIEINGVSIPGGVDVDTLTYNGYTQYNYETNVLRTFASNSNEINSLGVNITSISDNENVKKSIYEILDSMKLSVIFKEKYVATVESTLNTIDNEIKESGYTNIKTNRSDAVNKYKNINWKNEINSLSIIGANINEVASFDTSSIDTSEKRVKVINIVGQTLDEIEKSAFLGSVSASEIANKVVSALTGGIVTGINKGSYPTWSEAFNAKIPSI